MYKSEVSNMLSLKLPKKMLSRLSRLSIEPNWIWIQQILFPSSTELNHNSTITISIYINWIESQFNKYYSHLQQLNWVAIQQILFPSASTEFNLNSTNTISIGISWIESQFNKYEFHLLSYQLLFSLTQKSWSHFVTPAQIKS